MTDDETTPALDLTATKILAHARSIHATGLADHFVYVCLHRDDIYGGQLRFTADEVAALDKHRVRFAISDGMLRGRYAVSSLRPGKKSYESSNFEVRA